VQRWFITNTVPWEFSTSIAIAFYWLETINRVKAWKKEVGFMQQETVQRFLPKVKWLFVSLAVLLILLDFINVVMLSQLSDIPVLVFQSYAIFGIVEIIVAGFFIVAGFKILTILHKIQQKEKRMAWWQYLNPNIPSKVQLMSIRIMISGMGMIMTGVSSFCASSDLFNIPNDYVLILFFMTFGMLVTSLTHVLAIAPTASGRFNSSGETETDEKTSSKSKKKRETIDLKEIEVVVQEVTTPVEVQTAKESSSSESESESESKEEEKSEVKSSPDD